MTYVFGTIGSAYILGNLGPKMLGGLSKVKAQTAELERQLNQSSVIIGSGLYRSQPARGVPCL